jgi:hypothetical protein
MELSSFSRKHGTKVIKKMTKSRISWQVKTELHLANESKEEN